jgi:excisionase family DNA binding protein
MEGIGKEFLKPKDVVTMFRVTQETLRNWRRQGILPYFRIKNTVRFSRADVMEWLNKFKRNEKEADYAMKQTRK